MHFLVVGSGGREHALVWKLNQSPLVNKLTAIPGSDAISELAICEKINLSDHPKFIEYCQQMMVDLVIVGPEAPLVDGLIDSLKQAGIKCFGPSKFAAQLEGSKAFTKALCSEYNIPTAHYEVCENLSDALSYVKTKNEYPIVLKADGLAAGKGVIIAQDEQAAINGLTHIFDGAFGDAGSKVVIEEFLEGEEASLFVITDGDNTVILPPAQDHKRAFDGDQGPNTGGMGAYAPTPVMPSSIIEQAMQTIVLPTLKGLKDQGHPYSGVLYTGLMITQQGPKLIEYNVRFGDPECQVLMMLLNEDLAEICNDVSENKLTSKNLTHSNDHAMCIVMATKGYPDTYPKDTIIANLPDTEASTSNSILFHAGTKKHNKQWLSSGGRVLNICAQADELEIARDIAYKAIKKIDWKDGFYRSDIGKAAL